MVQPPIIGGDRGTWGQKLLDWIQDITGDAVSQATVDALAAQVSGNIAAIDAVEDDVATQGGDITALEAIVTPLATGTDRQRISIVDGSPVPTDLPVIFADDFDDGVLTDTQILAAALAAAPAGGATIFFGPRTYTFDGATVHVLPELTQIVGNGTTMVGAMFSPRSFSKVLHCTFNGPSWTYIMRADSTAGGSTQANDGVEFAYNKVIGVARVINGEYHNGGGDRSHHGWRVHDNDITGVTDAIVTIHARGWHVKDNDFRDSDERNILFYFGEDNTISGNTIDGGITGITFIVDRALAPDISIIQGNQVFNNKVRGCSEEGISIDSNGSDAAKTGVVEFDEVVSAASASAGTQNHVVLSAAGWSAAVGGTYYHYWLTFLTGALRGRSFRIEFNSVGTLVFFVDPTAVGPMSDADRALITAGDLVSIGLPARANSIYGNFVDASESVATGHGTKSGIILWGNAFQNSLFGNTVKNGNIEIFTYEGVVKPTPTYANNFGVAAAICNTVSMNTIENGDLLFGFIDYDGGSGTPEGAYAGNVAVGNIVGGKIITEHQQVFMSDNQPTQGYDHTGAAPNVMTMPNGTYMWVDATGDLRVSATLPTSDTGGTVVGTQS